MKRFEMEAEDEEREGFEENGESFRGQREKESRRMRKEREHPGYIQSHGNRLSLHIIDYNQGKKRARGRPDRLIINYRSKGNRLHTSKLSFLTDTRGAILSCLDLETRIPEVGSRNSECTTLSSDHSNYLELGIWISKLTSPPTIPPILSCLQCTTLTLDLQSSISVTTDKSE